MASKFDTFRTNEQLLLKIRERRKLLSLADQNPEPKIAIGIQQTTKSEGCIFPVLKFFNLL